MDRIIPILLYLSLSGASRFKIGMGLNGKSLRAPFGFQASIAYTIVCRRIDPLFCLMLSPSQPILSTYPSLPKTPSRIQLNMPHFQKQETTYISTMSNSLSFSHFFPIWTVAHFPIVMAVISPTNCDRLACSSPPLHEGSRVDM